jgi:hypothetical protein
MRRLALGPEEVMMDILYSVRDNQNQAPNHSSLTFPLFSLQIFSPSKPSTNMI